MDFAAGTLRDPEGADIPLRSQSLAVLRELARNAGSVVEKDALTDAVWKGVAVTDDSLVQCISEIRRALRDQSHTVLRTAPRRGYILSPVAAENAAPVIASRRWIARRAALAFGAIAALVLSAGTVLWLRPAPPLEEPPRIAVLPFEDMSASGGFGYLGDGVAEDIISMLARSPDVVVIARHSSFVYHDASADLREIGAALGVDFILEGSVRREGERLRIVAQLSDAHSGQNVWSERFDEAGSDPFALQDDVNGRIISSLTGEEGELKRAQYREAWGKDSSRLGEYDYFLRGLDVYMNAEDEAENDRAGQIWREGLKKYPDAALLKVKLGWYHWTSAWSYWSDEMAYHFREADRLVSEVLAMDRLSPEVRRVAYWLDAFVLMQRGTFSEAVRMAELAVAMAPYDARMLNGLAEVLIADGEYEMALDWGEVAMARNPARRETILAGRANTYRLMGRNAEAIEIFQGIEGLSAYMRLSQAIAHLHLGQLEEAKASVRAALADDPEFTRTLWREGSFYSDPGVLDSEIADLAAAGLPE